MYMYNTWVTHVEHMGDRLLPVTGFWNFPINKLDCLYKFVVFRVPFSMNWCDTFGRNALYASENTVFYKLYVYIYKIQ